MTTFSEIPKQVEDMLQSIGGTPSRRNLLISAFQNFWPLQNIFISFA